MSKIFADDALKNILQLSGNAQSDNPFDATSAAESYLNSTSVFDTTFNEFFGFESASNKKIDIEF